MKRKALGLSKILLLLLVIGFVMMIERGTLFADGRIIYTAATGSASDNSGDGTRNNPYNLFETALNNANDGDTIYILEPKGFVNAADNSPLVISKNITIKGDGTLFMVRKSGIVLDADVTFQNIELGLASRYHDAIFANGHTLTLNNVNCEAGARKVDIFGGGLYINGNAVAPSGNEAIINITGNGVNMGNIYAGSMNGDYSGNVSINLSELNSARNTDVYISGADEPYVDLDDIFNLTEPDAPRPNAGHTISGDVNVTIKNCNIINIEQIADSSCATSTLTVDTDGKFWGTVNIRRIDFLEVIGGGTLAPSECSNTTVVTLKSGSTINLSNIQIPVLKGLVSDNSLNNRLVLGKDHYLTVNNNISGRFIFETENGYNNHSGNAQYNYAYIRYTNTGVATNGIFTYTCIPGMDMTLDKYNNHTEGGNSYATVWKTSEASEYSPFPITGLTVHNPNITVTENEFKNSVTYNLTVSVSDDVAQNECWFDLVPIQYKVRYMGREYVGEAKFDGYSYYADIPELHMSFMSFSDIDLIDSIICVTTYIPGLGGSIKYPDTGAYTISVLP